jgi:hypothetical protein
MTIQQKPIEFRGSVIGYAGTLRQVATIARFHGADVDPVNQNKGWHAIVEGRERFVIEARIAP